MKHESNAAPGFDPSKFVAPKLSPPADQAKTPDNSCTEAQPLPDDLSETGERGTSTLPVPVLPLSPRPAIKSRFLLPDPTDCEDDEDAVFTPAPQSNPVVISSLEAGLYERSLGGGHHRLTCPWAAEHGPDADHEAIYTEPDPANPIGRFRCSHAHAERKNAMSLVEHLGLSPTAARAKPSVRIVNGEGHVVIAACEAVVAADEDWFHSDGPIVRLVRSRTDDVAVETVNDHTVRSKLATEADFYRKGRAGGWERCDPPDNALRSVMSSQDRTYLRPLSGITRQPFYDPEGNLITVPGYHAGTGRYGVFDQAEFRLGEPTREIAGYCLDHLTSILDEVHFATPHDRAAAVCAMLTGAVRSSLPLAPAFCITAPRSGGGKSYLADVIAAFATPSAPPKMPYPSNEEEATKSLLTSLRGMPSVIIFDDVQTNLRSLGPLNMALTSETMSARLLGTNRNATVPTASLFLFTGNNIEPERDMRRRVITIRLKPRGPSPALRCFRSDPLADIRKNRSRYVAAALTIIEAFRAAGSPVTEVPPIGSYDQWSTLCRHSLIWLGMPDPAQSLIEQVSHDPEQDALAAFVDVWVKEFVFASVTVRKIISVAEQNPKLMDVLVDLPVMDGNRVNPNKLGWYLRRMQGREANGYWIEPGRRSERNTWKVDSD